MNKLDHGPTSLSTLYFVPEFLKSLLDAADDNKCNHDEWDTINRQNRSIPRKNPYELTSNKSTLRCVNRKSVSDHETMAFVGLRDIIKVNSDELAKLYNYNNREYDTFQAAINNCNVDYMALINKDEFRIFYHFFSRVGDIDAWIEICNDFGFDLFFNSNHYKYFYSKTRNLKIRAKDKNKNQLRFFMQLIIYFWDNLPNSDKVKDDGIQNKDENCIFEYFWIKSISKAIKFVAELGVGKDIEVYCLLLKKWVKAKITDKDIDHDQLRVKFLNGQGKHLWYSRFSPRIAPTGFKYGYTPNMNKRNNVPCIISIIDEELNSIAPNHLPARNNPSPANPPHLKPTAVPISQHHANPVPINSVSTNAATINPANAIRNNKGNLMNGRQQQSNGIPKEGWYYKSQNNQVGPVSIAMLFLACVESKIDQSSSIFHSNFGFTTLNNLPHVVRAFRIHIQKCKSYNEAQHCQQRTQQTIAMVIQQQTLSHPFAVQRPTHQILPNQILPNQILSQQVSSRVPPQSLFTPTSNNSSSYQTNWNSHGFGGNYINLQNNSNTGVTDPNFNPFRQN